MYANVIVELSNKKVDKYFVYKVPDTFINKIKVGMRVKVEFGYQSLEGFVISLFSNYNSNYELKEIKDLVDDQPILNDEMLNLANFMTNKYLCSKISAYQVMLPKALKASNNTNIKIKKQKYLVLNKSIKEVCNYIEGCRYPKQQEILEGLILESKLKVNGLNSSINTLIKHGLVRIEQEVEYRYKANNDISDINYKLNDEQLRCVNEVTNNLDKSITYLLYGVTGSGKTEVYMNIIKEVINRGKTAIMLVPEISITPQIVNKFMGRFKEKIAIFHSGLSDGEKYDEYRKIVNKEVNIVIGARSAIFVPLDNIGVIIIDEEHTSTYKQETNPRYDARSIAIERSKVHNCPLVLGSATPSLESFAKAGNNVYKLITLSKRAGLSSLPKINIIDMKKEVKRNNFVISSLLDEGIKKCLDSNEQVILLLNRRGFSSMITCSSCGYVEKCPNCDISLTYHKSSNKLRCHYCNFSKDRDNSCLNCSSSNILEYGLGTEQLMEIIKDRYKGARVVRMDADTTNKKNSHELITKDFLNHKYDILIGTQMISKGLDFPLVTLVGVINADSSLNIPNFRSYEKTFQLLSQVSGRAGRSGIPGNVIIQAYNIDNYVFKYAGSHNYIGFYNQEMKLRKELRYPPYYFLITIKIACKEYELGFKTGNKIKAYLTKNLSKNCIVLGPTMANSFKVNNVYNYQCIIKYKKEDSLYKHLNIIYNHYKNDSLVDVSIDVDNQ